MIQFGFTKARNFMRRIKPEMILAKERSLKNFGIKAEGIAVKHMSKQDLGWKALTPAYLAQKIRMRRSEKTLISSASYFKAVTSWAEKDRVYVGIKRTVTNADGEVLADIAATMEYGSKKMSIPARPLWGPTLKEAIAWHRAHNLPEKLFIKAMKAYG